MSVKEYRTRTARIRTVYAQLWQYTNIRDRIQSVVKLSLDSLQYGMTGGLISGNSGLVIGRFLIRYASRVAEKARSVVDMCEADIDVVLLLDKSSS